jgi:hypothetical protein
MLPQRFLRAQLSSAEDRQKRVEDVGQCDWSVRSSVNWECNGPLEQLIDGTLPPP